MNFLDDLLAAWGNGQTPFAQSQMQTMQGGGMPIPDFVNAPAPGLPSMVGSMPRTPMPLQKPMLAGSGNTEGMSRRPPAAVVSGPEPVMADLAAPSFATTLSGALQGASEATGPLGALLGGIGGAIGANDAVTEKNQTFRLLKQRGLSDADAALAVKNPQYMQQLLTMLARKEAPMSEADQIELEKKRLELENMRNGKNSDVKYGFTPYFDDKGGAYVLGSDGSKKYLEFDNGAKPLPPGQLAEDKARGVATGKAIGEAKAALPSVLQTTSETLGALENLANDPYLDSMVGWYGGRAMDLSPDANRVVSKMDRIQGQAFLTAFKSLRGGGHITEIEGKKATDAIQRLGNRKMSPDDYRAAIDELSGIAKNGLIRAKVDAGVLPPEALNQLVDYETVQNVGKKEASPPQSGNLNPRGAPSSGPAQIDAGDGFVLKPIEVR